MHYIVMLYSFAHRPPGIQWCLIKNKNIYLYVNIYITKVYTHSLLISTDIYSLPPISF